MVFIFWVCCFDVIMWIREIRLYFNELSEWKVDILGFVRYKEYYNKVILEREREVGWYNDALFFGIECLVRLSC